MKLINKIILALLAKRGYTVTRKNENETAPYSAYFEIDPIFNPLYDLAREKTQMGGDDNLLRRERHYTLCNLLRNVSISDGDVCELGCWRGLSTYQLATQLKERNFQNEFSLFDSFEGLSEVNEIDKRNDVDIDYNKKRKLFECSEDIVKENLKEFNFIKYYKGWVPDRFEEVKDKRFSFVHVDLDLYQPIIDSIKFFYPRLNTGGVMVFDDYGCATFPGAKKAVDEALQELEDAFFLPLPSGQAFIYKK